MVLLETGGPDTGAGADAGLLPHAPTTKAAAIAWTTRNPDATRMQGSSYRYSGTRQTRARENGRPRKERGLGGNARRSFQRPRHGTETEAPSVPQSRRARHHLAPLGACPCTLRRVRRYGTRAGDARTCPHSEQGVCRRVSREQTRKVVVVEPILYARSKRLHRA